MRVGGRGDSEWGSLGAPTSRTLQRFVPFCGQPRHPLYIRKESMALIVVPEEMPPLE